MDLLLPGADFLCAGTLGESNRLHAPGCIVLDSLVAEKADHDAPSYANCSFFRPRRWNGVTRSLVGTLSSGNEPRRVSVPQPDRAIPGREPGCLVLPEQNLLAFESDLYKGQIRRPKDFAQVKPNSPARDQESLDRAEERKHDAVRSLMIAFLPNCE